MKKMTSKEVRQEWLNYFENKGHEVIESKSLIPVNDPSILWINSGVATLKDYFSGKKKPNNPKMTNSQKSIRTNDIDNVGVTSRHHTFFEMLGNFSIGDYFKNEAIEFGYDVVFNLFGFDKDKIYITYYDEDQDTLNRWLELGIKEDHLIKGDKETNFWDIGSGPCGPCTEIFYDRGEKYDPQNIGIKLLQEDLENDRYIEIWNIVFSQFNNDGEGNYEELKQKNIDTGAGLERIVSILQDAPTNFDTDLFLPIIHEVEKHTEKKYDVNNYFDNNQEQKAINKKFKVIADHMRAVTMAIQDGAKPSNTQRGYIIRRLIRRAYRSGIQLNINEETFLYKLVDIVSEVLDVYTVDKDRVKEIIKKEELAFSRTIKQGEKLLQQELSKTAGEFDTEVAFKLFETFGFPIELTKEILEEKNISIDMDKFYALKDKHAEASRGKTHKGMAQQIQVIQKIDKKVSEFVGYDTLESSSKLIVQEEENGKWYILLDKTPFYSTKGGQQYDKGTLNGINVIDSFEDKFGNHWHVTNEKVEGDNVEAKVFSDIRLMKERNHTGTHLLGSGIQKVFGQSIQLGSENDENRLRLDFPLDKKPTEEELQQVEDEVNKMIQRDINREYILAKFQEAVDMGTIFLEGVDYGEGDLRVVKFDESIEFCGGTHISNTAKLERFKITKLESKGSGVYRIEGITSNKTIEEYENKLINSLKEEVQNLITKNQQLDKTYSIEVPNSIQELEKLKIKLKEDNKAIRKNNSNVTFDDENIEFKEIDGVKTFIKTDFTNPGQIKPLSISISKKYPDAIIILGSENNGFTTLCVASERHNAKDKFQELAEKHNGRGGGNDNFAMGKIEGSI